MSFEHRSYGGKLFRPSPIVHAEEGESLIIVVTPWGEAESVDKIVQTMVDYFMSALDDFEATSPFEKLSCLSMTANHLRISCLIANDMLYRDQNKSEYQMGIEVFAAAHIDKELVFVQSGLPHILLKRKNRGLMPISSSIDLSFDLSEGEEILSPLPNQILGIDPTCHLNVNSLRPQDGDQLVMLSRSSMPAELFAADVDMSLNGISNVLAKENVDMPFWLGLFSF